MSLVAAFALAASSVTLPNCSWDKPGVNPFMGDLVAAVDRYRDIPAATRAKLKARMAERQYDEIVDIHRDSIVGRYDYGSDIREMHFGAGSVCKTVTRTKWNDQMLERGLVYCEDGECILVPTVCRNVSRISRGKLKPAAAGGTPVAKNDEEAPLMFEPPAAGAPADNGGAGDPGSFARTAGLPTATSSNSLVSTPGSSGGGAGGGGTPMPGGSPGVITLPQLPQGGGGVIVNPVPSVPEPQTWLLFALGLGALALAAKRRAA